MRILFLFLFEVFVSVTVAQADATYLYGKSAFVGEINQIVSSANAEADIAVFIKSMKNGDRLYARNINHSLAPASTLKILTAEAALIYLGSRYRFATQLLTNAKEVKDGELQGNVYILLNGDPTLTFTDLATLLYTLKNNGVKAISGNVYIDNTAYDNSVYGPGWDMKDKVYCYAAPISASIINHNCLAFQINPSRAGKSVNIVTSPKYFYPLIKNSVVTKEKRKNNCSVHVSNLPGTIVIDGCMTRGQTPWGITYVLSNLQEYNRALFKNIFKRLKIQVKGTFGFASAPNEASLIQEHDSKPLNQLIHDMMKKSDNIIAGALFKKIGQLYNNQPGSWENASIAVKKILAYHAGVFTDNLKILDGSGLSPDNLTTPAQLMQVLNFAYHHYATSYEFIASLPIAGVDGTLKNRMNNIAGRVRAKTGTISGVVSLAGYAISADKEPIAFVIMINGRKGASAWEYRVLEDKIVYAITRYRRNF